jgi:phenylalanyl-tRNA synthetase beta chain
MCVIADEKGVESLAGIMGGEATGCSETTADVLIESALWDALNIAQTGRKLGVNSDARYRFERGVDPNFMLPGLELATQMMLDLCGGTPSEIVIAGDPTPKETIIDFPLSELPRLAGIRLPLPEVRRVLEKLGFFAAGQGEKVKVAVPSWRPDVHGRADIVEELVRIVGVDQVPSTPFPRGDNARKAVLTPIQNRTRKAKRSLAARAMVEAVTWSFVSKREAELFGGGKPELALANPIAAELSDMRPSLIPGLTMSAQRNADRGSADVALFEVGQIFKGDQPQDQLIAATGLRRALAKGSGIGRHWSSTASPVDVFDAKADAFAVLAAAGAPMQALQVVPGGPAWFHPGRSGTIQIGPQNVLGHFGELHPRVISALKAEGSLVAFEVILDKIPEPKAKATCAKPLLDLSPFQPVERDFAFVVENSVKAADIVRAAQSVDKKLIVGVTVFDVYEGNGVDPGKKSIAIAVTMQPREKTMTDAEIDALGSRIVAEVGKKTGGVLRG